jgi:hypothetical protein
MIGQTSTLEFNIAIKLGLWFPLDFTTAAKSLLIRHPAPLG